MRRDSQEGPRSDEFIRRMDSGHSGCCFSGAEIEQLAKHQKNHRSGRGTCPRSSYWRFTQTSRKTESGDKSLFPTCELLQIERSLFRRSYSVARLIAV